MQKAAGTGIPCPASGPALEEAFGKRREGAFTWHESCLRLHYYYCCGARSDGSVDGEAGTRPPYAGAELEQSRMTILDLMKATVICGVIAFLIYSYPIIGQIVLIGFLSLLWLLYAHKTIAHLRRR
jgi:hypothetical protein